MLEKPPQASGIAFWISGSANRVKSEANAKDPPDHPVSDGVAEEIQQNPA